MILWLIFVPMIVASLLFLLWPLKFPPRRRGDPEDDLAANRVLYRDKVAQLEQQREHGEVNPEQFRALELEYQRQFLADSEQVIGHSGGAAGRLPLLVCALAIPVIAVLLYRHMGALPEMELRQQLESRSALFIQGRGDSEEFQLATRTVIESMEELAERRPDNPTYHVLLARLLADGGDYERAIPHYVKAVTLMPKSGDILAEYAQVLFFAGGNRMSDRIRTLTLEALKLSPQNHSALSLAGIVSFNESNFAEAIDYWQQALAQLPPGAPSGAALESGIAAARERLGQAPAPAAADRGRSLKLQVSLDDSIEVSADATVFVYARAWQGSPMPLAIARLQVSDLPAEIVLTEAMAMTPANSLATVDQVEVVARVSLSGAPTPAPGDYQVTQGPVDVASRENPISLSINAKIPQ